MGILDKIKSDVKKAGTNKGKIMFFREGVKVRVRFLSDIDEGMEVVFHDSYEAGINVPCQEAFGRSCEYCDNEDLRTRSMYAWSVWDYEAKEIKIILAAVNNCSPVPAFMALYEQYGTMVDRDYVISVSGKMQNKSFSVIPMDKVKFRNSKAKPLSEDKILEILDKAYPADDSDEEEDKPVKKSSKKSTNKSKKKEDEEWDDEEDLEDYSELSAKELYKLCKEREIECVPKKSEKYYINLLEEWDNAQEDWAEDDEEEDDWEDEE